MIKLNCPSCNGALELPDDLGVAHCMYCGTKILLQQSGDLREKQSLERYVELAKVALEAKNYDEAIQYCNKTLEIDPKNVQAWIDKAISTFWLTTGAHNRYDEAMGYLKKAVQIAPDDIRIINERDQLAGLQAWWLNKLGNDTFKNAQEIADLPAGTWEGAEDVRKSSQKLFVEAMNYYLEAASHAPGDEVILENIAACAKAGWWISWSDTVSSDARRLGRIRTRKHAEANLPILRQQLQVAQANLKTLKMEKGLLTSFKINDAEKKVQKIQEEIATLEKAAAYQIPTPQY